MVLAEEDDFGRKKERARERDELWVVYVRETSGWKDDYIEGAERIFFGHLEGKADSLPKDKPGVVVYSVNQRVSTGASTLKREVFKEIYNVLGGMTA